MAFEGTEAILLSVSKFLNVLSFLLNPSLFDQIPLPQTEATVAALNAPNVTVFAPIIERAFTILVHLLATVLVYAVVLNKSFRIFWLSFLYPGTIDATVPGLGRLLAESPNPVVMTYTIELVIVIYGLLGLLRVR